MYIFRPHELPRQQRELSRWWQSEFGVRYADGWIEDTRRRGARMFVDEANGPDLALQEAHRVLENEPYWVDPEMVELAEHAAKTVPDFKLQEDMLPSATGFMYLAYPRLVKDINSRLVSEQLIVWNSTGSYRNSSGDVHAGVYITWYSDRDSDGDESLPDMDPRGRRQLGQFVLLHVAFWPYGTPFSGGQAMGKNGKLVSFDEHPEYDWRRFVVTAWRLMSQSLVSSVAVPAGRVETKAALRAKAPVHPVRVITLRRYQPPATAIGADVVEHRGVDWKCRWMVRGHWRLQPYKDGPRPIWIDPFIKGPEDRPLRFSDHINVWRR